MLPKRCRITPSHCFSSPQFHPQRNGFQKNMHLNLDHFPISSSKPPPTLPSPETTISPENTRLPKRNSYTSQASIFRGANRRVWVTASPPTNSQPKRRCKRSSQLHRRWCCQTWHLNLSDCGQLLLGWWWCHLSLGTPTKASILIHRLKFPSFTHYFFSIVVVYTSSSKFGSLPFLKSVVTSRDF